MAMRDDSEDFANDEPNDLGNEDQQVWYFDVPDGAWARQEQKNKDLRAMVRSNLSEKPQKQKAFSQQPSTFGQEAQEPAPKKGGLSFGRRKEEPRTSESWRQGREKMSFDEMSSTPANAWSEEDAVVEEPADAPLRPLARDQRGPQQPVYREPGARESGPLPLRLRRSAPPPPPLNDGNEGGTPEGGSRWDAMFSGPADMSIVDAMRAWSSDEPHPTRQIPASRPAKEKEVFDPAARWMDAGEGEDDALEAAPAEDPEIEPDSAVSDFLARIRGRKAGLDQAEMRSLDETIQRTVPRAPDEPDEPAAELLAFTREEEPVSLESFVREPVANDEADDTPIDEPGGIDNPSDIVGGMRAWAAGKTERRPRTFGSLAESSDPAPRQPVARPEPVAEPVRERQEAPAAHLAEPVEDAGIDNPADIVGGMRAWASGRKAAPAAIAPPAFEPVAREQSFADFAPVELHQPVPTVTEPVTEPVALEPSRFAFEEAQAADEPGGVDNPSDIVGSMRSWAAMRDRPQQDSKPNAIQPAPEAPASFEREPASLSDFAAMRRDALEGDGDGDWEMPEQPTAKVHHLAMEPTTEWNTGVEPKAPPAADEPLTLWASANDDITAVDNELSGNRKGSEKKGGLMGRLFGRKKKDPVAEQTVTDASEWLMPDGMNRLDAPKPNILGDFDSGEDAWLPPEGATPTFGARSPGMESAWQAVQADALASSPRDELTSFEAFIEPAPLAPLAAPASSKDEWTWESLAEITPMPAVEEPAAAMPALALPVEVVEEGGWESLATLADEPVALVEPLVVEDLEEEIAPWSVAEALAEQVDEPSALVEPVSVEVAEDEDDTPRSFAEALADEVDEPVALVEGAQVEVAEDEGDTPWSFAEALADEADKPVALVEVASGEVAEDEDDTPWSFAEALVDVAEPVALVEVASGEVAEDEDDTPWSFAEALVDVADEVDEPVALVEGAPEEVAEDEDDTPWSFAEALVDVAEPVALVEVAPGEVAEEEDDKPWSFAEALADEVDEPVALVEVASGEVAEDEDDTPRSFAEALADEVDEPVALVEGAPEEVAEDEDDTPWSFAEALVDVAEPVALVEVASGEVAEDEDETPWSFAEALADEVAEPVALVEAVAPVAVPEPESSDWDFGAWLDVATPGSVVESPVAPVALVDEANEEDEEEAEPFDFSTIFAVEAPVAAIVAGPVADDDAFEFDETFACFDHDAVTTFALEVARSRAAAIASEAIVAMDADEEVEWGFIEEVDPETLVEPVEMLAEVPAFIIEPEDLAESVDPSYAWESFSTDESVFSTEKVKEDGDAFEASLPHHGETMTSESRPNGWNEEPAKPNSADPFAPRFDSEDEESWSPEPTAWEPAPVSGAPASEQPRFDFEAKPVPQQAEESPLEFDDVYSWEPEDVAPAAAIASSPSGEPEGFDLFSAPMSEVAGRLENPRIAPGAPIAPSAPAPEVPYGDPEATSRQDAGWDAVVSAATDLIDDDTPQPLVRVSRGYAGWSAPATAAPTPQYDSPAEEALEGSLAADDEDSGIEEFDMSNWRAAWKSEQDNARPGASAPFQGSDNESDWELGNGTDVVLRAFEAHARQDVPEPPKEEIAAELFRYAKEDSDDFEGLLGDDADELVGESGDMQVDEHTGFARVAGWAPQRTIITDDEELPPWAVRASGVSESRTNWVGTPGRLEDLAPPWASAAEEEEEPVETRHRSRSIVRELVETGLLAILVFLSVRASFQNFKVDGRSMEPTLADGEFLIVNKLVYSKIDLEKLSNFVPFVDPGADPQRNVFHGPERGDIIVLKHPSHPETDLIKRVVGLPGETVEIRDGVVHINGQPLEEEYIPTAWQYTGSKTVIGPGEYFVMGDNRNNSSDSRASNIGLIPEELIIGKAMVTYWPTDKFGLAPNEAGKVAAAGLGSLTEASQAPLFGSTTLLFMLEVALGITLVRWASRRVTALVRSR